MNDILNKYEELKQENTSLKLELKEKCFKLKNLGKKYQSQMIIDIHY